MRCEEQIIQALKHLLGLSSQISCDELLASIQSLVNRVYPEIIEHTDLITMHITQGQNFCRGKFTRNADQLVFITSSMKGGGTLGDQDKQEHIKRLYREFNCINETGCIRNGRRVEDLYNQETDRE